MFHHLICLLATDFLHYSLTTLHLRHFVEVLHSGPDSLEPFFTDLYRPNALPVAQPTALQHWRKGRRAIDGCDNLHNTARGVTTTFFSVGRGMLLSE